jgi:arylformamidase
MNIIDISWPISERMTEYKNKGSVRFSWVKTFEKDGARESCIALNTHSGTHVDAPAHFLPTEAMIESFKLSQMCGPCRVLDLTHVNDSITQADLESHDIKHNEIILLRTKNSALEPDAPFNPNFIYLEKQAAHYLAEKKIKAVGIDYLGIERGQPEHETHTALLDSNCPVIEGLRLEHVAAGAYTLVCLPLNIIGLEAAPARAVLLAR